MTLAALSPLYTWWPLFLVILLFLTKVICPLVVRHQSEPPAELVAYLSGWPPPHLAWKGFPTTLGYVIYDDTIRDPWAPPLPPPVYANWPPPVMT